MSARGINTPDKQALKAAGKALVRAAGGVEAAAEYTRPGKSLLSEYGRPEGDCFMPVDVVVDLEAITHGAPDWPIVTRFLASRAGCSLVALPDAADLGSDWLGVVGKLTGELGDVTKGICTAAGDGVICADDVRRHDLIAQCDDLIAVAVNLRARFERIEADGHRGT